jgi:hypothetical protein
MLDTGKSETGKKRGQGFRGARTYPDSASLEHLNPG